MRLQHDADVIQFKLRTQPLEDVDRYLRHVRSFHVDAHEIAAPPRFLDDAPGVLVRELRIQAEAKLRELDRDIGTNARLVNPLQDVQILFDFVVRLVSVVHRLVQMIERGRAVLGIDLANERNYLVERLAGDEAGGQFVKEFESGGKIFQAFLAGQPNQRASSYHQSNL